MTTIEEEARQFAGFKHGIKENEFIYAVRDLSYDGFKTGAKWMLEKAVKWLKENAQNYYEDDAMHDNCWYDDEQMIEDFQKAMEEE